MNGPAGHWLVHVHRGPGDLACAEREQEGGGVAELVRFADTASGIRIRSTIVQVFRDVAARLKRGVLGLTPADDANGESGDSDFVGSEIGGVLWLGSAWRCTGRMLLRRGSEIAGRQKDRAVVTGRAW